MHTDCGTRAAAASDCARGIVSPRASATLRTDARLADARLADRRFAHASRRPGEAPEVCDVCGSAAIEWRKCKLVCTHCGSILMTCGDL